MRIPRSASEGWHRELLPFSSLEGDSLGSEVVCFDVKLEAGKVLSVAKELKGVPEITASKEQEEEEEGGGMEEARRATAFSLSTSADLFIAAGKWI